MILLVMGLGSALILSLLMQRAVRIRKDQAGGRVAREIEKIYGSRLASAVTYEVTGGKKSDGVVELQKGIVTIQPQLPSAGPRLARDVGRFVWSVARDLDRLEVVVKRHSADQGRPFPIPRPYERGVAPGAKMSKSKTQSKRPKRALQLPSSRGTSQPSSRPASSRSPSRRPQGRQMSPPR